MAKRAMTDAEQRLASEVRRLKAKAAHLEQRVGRFQSLEKVRSTDFERGSVADPLRRLVRRGLGPNGLPDARPKRGEVG